MKKNHEKIVEQISSPLGAKAMAGRWEKNLSKVYCDKNLAS